LNQKLLEADSYC